MWNIIKYANMSLFKVKAQYFVSSKKKNESIIHFLASLFEKHDKVCSLVREKLIP